MDHIFHITGNIFVLLFNTYTKEMYSPRKYKDKKVGVTFVYNTCSVTSCFGNETIYYDLMFIG